MVVEVAICLPLSCPITTLAVFVGATWAVFNFLHQDHLQTARFCKELSTEFNRRYDKMNNRLQTLVQQSGDFSKKGTLAFVDYFNLCAEEYLFHEAGYIYEQMWESWVNGMKQYSKETRVASIWAEEKKTNSYYGFELPVERSVAAIQGGQASP
jgi:hypothetical protein